MISTVTTTVSTIVSSSTVGGLVGSLGAAAVLTLIASLAIKELATHGVVKVKLFSQNLVVVVLPLLFVFTFIVSMAVLEILS